MHAAVGEKIVGRQRTDGRLFSFIYMMMICDRVCTRKPVLSTQNTPYRYIHIMVSISFCVYTI